MKADYARVSTNEQTDSAQLDALKDAGCEQVYQKTGSGKSRQRPELDRMIDSLRVGGVAIVQRLDRLGQSLKGLIELLDGLKQKDVQFISLNESIDSTTAVGRLAFHMIASTAQFERKLISERTRAGLEAVRAPGRIVGSKQTLTSEDIKKAQALMLAPQMTYAEVANIFSCMSPNIE